MSFLKSKLLLIFLVYFSSGAFALSENLITGIEKNKILLNLLEKTGVSHEGTLKDIVKKTQKYWIRKGERWEAQKEEFESLRETLWPLFTSFGHVKDRAPKETKYDAVLLLGAFYERMCLRFGHLIELWKQGVRFDRLYFLVGERDADLEKETPDIIRRETDLIPFKPGWQGITKSIKLDTETDIARFIYQAADLPSNLRDVPCTFVHAPRRHKTRPNTADTFKEWIKDLPYDFPRNARVLVISNQPYVPYQYAVSINEISKNGIHVNGKEGSLDSASYIQLDITGTEINPEMPVLLILDAIARRLWVTQKYLNRTK